MGVTPNIQLTASEWQIVSSLLQEYLPDVTVWAYGSRVKLKAGRTSDLDLVVFAEERQNASVSRLKEAFEESNLPYSVDLHVWRTVPARFRSEIQQKYLEIQSGDHTSAGNRSE